MKTETDVRTFAHQLVDRMDLERLKALLDLLDEEYFTPEETARIRESLASHEWYDWREVRNDL